jgi:hypothetical protein
MEKKGCDMNEKHKERWRRRAAKRIGNSRSKYLVSVIFVESTNPVNLYHGLSPTRGTGCKDRP